MPKRIEPIKHCACLDCPERKGGECNCGPKEKCPIAPTQTHGVLQIEFPEDRVTETTERIVIDYSNLSGRESMNRGEFRKRTIAHLSTTFNEWIAENEQKLMEQAERYALQTSKVSYEPAERTEEDWEKAFDNGTGLTIKAGLMEIFILSAQTKQYNMVKDFIRKTLATQKAEIRSRAMHLSATETQDVAMYKLISELL